MNIYPSFSIIIPAYNSENYLAQCLDSIKIQKNNNIQLIVVDDGSTDGTAVIIQRYKESGVIDIAISKENGGQSSARNAAFPYINGDYIVFVDSDDLLSENAFSVIAQYLREFELDVLLYDATEFYDQVEKIAGKINTYNRPTEIYKKILSGKDFFNTSVQQYKYNVSPCMYALKNSICKNIQFIPGVTSEDNVFTTQMLFDPLAKRVMAIEDKLYTRRLRPDSEVTRAKTLHNYISYIRVFEELLKLAKNTSSTQLYIFQGNILALASKSLTEIMSLNFYEKFKYRLELIKLAILNPRTLSLRLMLSLMMPSLYLQLAPFCKKILIKNK